MTPKLKYDTHKVYWSLDWRKRNFREDGPCEIHNDGEVFFAHSELNTLFNRRVGPARIWPDGKIVYTNILGLLHRTDGPAIIYPNGVYQYWVNGKHMPAEEFFLKYSVL